MSLGGLDAVCREGFPGSWPQSKANRRVSGEAETKGVEIPNLLTLWTLRGCSQPQQLKRMRRGEQKKQTVRSLLDIIILRPAWAEDHCDRTKSQRRRQWEQTEAPASE